jgi:hypothetical protein
MKTSFLAQKLMLVGLTVLCCAAVSNVGGPSPGYSGAPGEATCSAAGCHGKANADNQHKGKMALRIGDDLTAYKPGQSYTLTVKLADPAQDGRMGFLVTALTDKKVAAGKFKSLNGEVSIASEDIGGSKRFYARHTTEGNRPSIPKAKAWTLTWTAPPAGSGPVTLYAAGVCGNGNLQADAEDHTYTTKLVLQEAN